LRRAIDFASQEGAGGVLIVPGDLPQLKGGSVAALLAAVERFPAVGIVPDHHHTGTNGLLLIPPAIIAPAFGVDSWMRHRKAAEAAGAQVILWEDALWGEDVDLPEDLALVEPDLWQNKSSLD
jgi:2-phospho-L-lactate guanylyltransferase (CobY/MobA/RfbA family)